MTRKKQNPGDQAGALPIASLLVRSHSVSTPRQRQAQLLARRYGLPLWKARNIAFLAFGGGDLDR